VRLVAGGVEDLHYDVAAVLTTVHVIVARLQSAVESVRRRPKHMLMWQQGF
jgi:hypothetical protein